MLLQNEANRNHYLEPAYSYEIAVGVLSILNDEEPESISSWGSTGRLMIALTAVLIPPDVAVCILVFELSLITPLLIVILKEVNYKHLSQSKRSKK